MNVRPPNSRDPSGTGTSSPCPSDVELAAFSDAGLDPARQREIALHVLRCPECTDVIGTIAHHLEETQRERPALPLRWAALAAGLLLAVALGWGGLAWWRSQDSGIAALARATGERRLVDARLSGGFAWAPRTVTRSAGEPAPSSSGWEIAGVASRLPDSDVHALGVAHLLMGNAEEAIARLETAARDVPQDPAVLSDLAAALLERGRRSGRAPDLARARAVAEQALALAPGSPEPRFNRALALETLGLREAAIAAWEDYLEVDAGSAWAGEARERLQRLRTVPPDRKRE